MRSGWRYTRYKGSYRLRTRYMRSATRYTRNGMDLNLIFRASSRSGKVGKFSIEASKSI